MDQKAARATRLEMAKLCRVLGKEPWDILSSPAMPAEPSVSVVVTVYNYRQYLAECLESLRASEVDDLPGGFEVLVIDDASTDGSAAFVERYLREHPSVPFRLVRKTFNTGVADARNVGFELACAPYVFVLDADNWIYPRALRVLHENIRGSGHAAVYGMIRKFDSATGRSVGLLSFHDWDVREMVRMPYLDAMAMFERKAVLALGGYSPAVYPGWADYDLWLRLAVDGFSAKRVAEILTSYRVHGESMLTTTTNEVLETARLFKARFRELAREHGDQDRLFGWPHVMLDGTEPWQPGTSGVPDDRQLPMPDEVQRLKVELDKARARIAFMESSRFWTLRNQWIRLKRRLGAPVTP